MVGPSYLTKLNFDQAFKVANKTCLFSQKPRFYYLLGWFYLDQTVWCWNDTPIWVRRLRDFRYYWKILSFIICIKWICKNVAKGLIGSKKKSFYHFYAVVMIEERSNVQKVAFINHCICICWVFAFDPGVKYCSVLCVLCSFTMVPLWSRELII